MVVKTKYECHTVTKLKINLVTVGGVTKSQKCLVTVLVTVW